MKNKILMLGTFDTKGQEFAYLRSELLRHGAEVLTLNAGIMEAKIPFEVDIDAETVAAAGGRSLELLRREADRGAAVTAMGQGAKEIAGALFAQERICGAIGMGGGGGTSIATAAMSALPIGVPKICITTLASGDTSPYIGSKDILLFPSIVDISGINAFSRKIISNAAAAMAGMAKNLCTACNEQGSGAVLLSMFGNTTAAGNACSDLLGQAGYDTLVFHAVGSGGRALEDLTRDGFCEAVLDLTTTEWADELCGGIFSSGKTRLDAPGEKRIPHLIIPGCLDMVNFGPPETVPTSFQNAGRTFFRWAPEAVLMRTDERENAELGRIFAGKANRAPMTTAFLIPLDGFSELGRRGGAFWRPTADKAFLTALRENLNPRIPVETISCNINDAAFAERAVSMLLELIESTPKNNEEKG